MVEYSRNLDSVFHSLSDPIRRDILYRVTNAELSVGELVSHYDMSFAAVSKHIQVLQASSLITKRKEGKKQIIKLAPDALHIVDRYLEQYRQIWQSKHDKLAALLQKDK